MKTFCVRQYHLTHQSSDSSQSDKEYIYQCTATDRPQPLTVSCLSESFILLKYYWSTQKISNVQTRDRHGRRVLQVPYPIQQLHHGATKPRSLIRFLPIPCPDEGDRCWVSNPTPIEKKLKLPRKRTITSIGICCLLKRCFGWLCI